MSSAFINEEQWWIASSTSCNLTLCLQYTEYILFTLFIII